MPEVCRWNSLLNIKSKILLKSSVTLLFAIGIILFCVLNILNQSISQQAEELYSGLYSQSDLRVRANNKILKNLIDHQIESFQNEVSAICRSSLVKRGISNGQWKSLENHLNTVFSGSDVDFIVFFSPSGKAEIAWPDKVKTEYLQTDIEQSPLFKTFKKNIENEDFVDAPVFLSFERVGIKRHGSYGIKSGNGILSLAAGVISNEYFDEPLGYVLAGFKLSRLSGVLESFFNTTGQSALLTDGQTSLAWAGLPGGKKDIAKALESYPFEQIRNSASGDVKTFFVQGNVYHVSSFPVKNVSGDLIGAVLTGEPQEVVISEIDKIKAHGEKTRSNAVNIILAVFFIVLVLTWIINLIFGEKIVEPIRQSARIAEKIASGDLNHDLDESARDETGRLAKSINMMVKSLKNLITKNEEQMDALKKARSMLELRVKERTEELSTANRELKENENRFRSLSDAAFDGICISRKGVLLDVNDNLCEMFGYSAQELTGRGISELVKPEDREGIKDKIRSGFEQIDEVNGLKKDGTIFPMEVRSRLFLYRGDRARVIALQDITERRLREEEREKLISELQEAVENVKTLSGLLPICCSCKKIRDDKGYWNDLEGYIENHSEAFFSHSMCSQCSDKLYGKEGWYIKMKKKRSRE